tara:strand:- start:1511 stop:1675 length:165 start_codon:yes stop_codon:yes gene_type:complete
MSIEKIKILERLLDKKHITVNEAKLLITCEKVNFNLTVFDKYEVINPHNIQAFQ